MGVNHSTMRFSSGGLRKSHAELPDLLTTKFQPCPEAVALRSAEGLLVRLGCGLLRLAKISGIVPAYPTLRLEVEGHTDSVGTDRLNMLLSENRANSVRDFLIHEGMASTSIASRGFGKSQPVATNDTPAGRQQNRGVELVVSGDVIGSSVGSAAEAKENQ
jgi:OmpA family